MNLGNRPQKYRPSTTAEAKIWNKYNDTKIIKPGQIDDRWDWIPIWKWPMDLAKGVMKRELGYTQRFRLFLYFVGNGKDKIFVFNKSSFLSLSSISIVLMALTWMC